MDELKRNALERQERRFKFLQAVYRRTGENMFSAQRVEWVASDLNLDPDTANQIADYLEKEGLISYANLGGDIFITNRGIYEVEKALTRPEETTEHFPANVIHVGSMTHSVIQQATHSSSVNFSISPEAHKTLQALVADIKANAPALQLGPDTKAQMNADIASTEVQLQSPRPKYSIVKDGLEGIGKTIAAAATTAVANGLAEKITQAIKTHLGG